MWTELAIDEDAEWMTAANCRDQPPALFFPSDDRGVRAAHQVCAGCVVRGDCLRYALNKEIAHGVWGGLSEEARRQRGRTDQIGGGGGPV